MFLQQVLSKLCRLRYDAVRDLVQNPTTKLIFLGVEKQTAPGSLKQEGSWEPPAWFAIGTGEDAAELLKRCREKNCFFPPSPNRDLLKFSEEEAGSEWSESFSAWQLKSKPL